MIKFYNTDNIRFMKTKADNYYDLAIVDPPYGINASKRKSYFSNNKKQYKEKEWDNAIPTSEYFEQLFRVSKNQIIWGGNYFIEHLHSSKCWITWDKMNGTNDMPDCELAWTSFNTKMRLFQMHHFSKDVKFERIHQTQKPVKLYRWMLQEFAEPDFKIIDTHGGSFTHAIAAEIEGFSLDIMDIDKEYYESGLTQYNAFIKQKTLF
jgi:site-specific DNA-methyltransferase (adenine-specific)